MFSKKSVGSEGENISLAFLQKNGYKIIEKNFRTRYGEIDIIAEEGRELVFIEVKRRRSGGFGKPYEAVNGRKQEHIAKSALQYMKLRRLFGRSVRFDVVSVGPGRDEIELIRSAFSVERRYTY